MSSDWIQLGNSFDQNLRKRLDPASLNFNCISELRVLHTERAVGLGGEKCVKVTVTSGQEPEPGEQQTSCTWTFSP